MPTTWHFRGDSDCNRIMSRMRVIPEHLRAEVAEGYDKIFMPNVNNTGRKDANEWLDEIARQYKGDIEQPRVKREIQQQRKATPRHVKSNKKPAVSDCGLWSIKLNQ